MNKTFNVNAEKVVVKEHKVQIKPLEFGLLDKEMAETISTDLLKADKEWFLSNPGLYNGRVMCISQDGFINTVGLEANTVQGIRPIFKFISPNEFNIGKDKIFDDFGTPYTIIAQADYNTEHYYTALADHSIAEQEFKKCNWSDVSHAYWRDGKRVARPNDYDNSDVKEFLDGRFRNLFAEKTAENTEKAVTENDDMPKFEDELEK